jgi:hypothetical protein
MFVVTLPLLHPAGCRVQLLCPTLELACLALPLFTPGHVHLWPAVAKHGFFLSAAVTWHNNISLLLH